MIDLSLVGKKAVISGSSQGIGKAIALELASLGASCILLSRNEEMLQQVCDSLDTTHGQAHEFYVVDFNDREALERLISTIASKKQIEILINNTGGPAA